MATALSDSDGEMLEVMEDAVRDEAGDIEMGEDMDNDGSEHLLDAPEQELQECQSIPRARAQSQTGTQSFSPCPAFTG